MESDEKDYALDMLIDKLKEIKKGEVYSKYIECADCRRIRDIIDDLIEKAETYRR